MSPDYPPAYATVEVIPAATSAPTPVYSYAITSYYANGNIGAYGDSINGTWSQISYDNLNRLIAAKQTPYGATTPAQFDCWLYDSFGNRTIQASESNNAPSSGCQPYSSSDAYIGSLLYYAGTNASAGGGNPNTNQITGGATENQNGAIQPWPSIPSQHQMYDAAGNYIYDAVSNNQYLYDAQGHICAARTAVGMTGYLYNTDGIRIAKGSISSMSCDPVTANFQVITTYMLGPDGSTITEVDAGAWAKTHVTANGQQVATYDSGGVHFHIHDWLGTRRVQTNAAGVPEDWCSNQPFGDQQSCYLISDASDRHFTGKERDTESGLDYFGARYFGSSMGRFQSPDPSGLNFADLSNPQSLNLYAYVMNNPMNSVDPNGLEDDPCGGGTVVAAGGTGDGPSPCPGGGIVPPPPNPPEIDPCQGQSSDCGQQQLAGFISNNASFFSYASTLYPACGSALAVTRKDRAGVQRALFAWPTLQQAGSANGVSPSLLAAIGTRESDFRDINQTGGGVGVGVFQLTVSPGSPYTASQANNLPQAANAAAKMESSNARYLGRKFPNLTAPQLSQATAAAYNYGPGNVSGNPATIDKGSTGGNYGSNVIQLQTTCFAY